MSEQLLTPERVRLLDTHQLAEYIGVGHRTAERLVATGEIPSLKIGRRRLVDRIDVDSWIDRVKAEEDI